MDGKQYDDYISFTHKFLDTIDVAEYIKPNEVVGGSMRKIENDKSILYRTFCEYAEKNGSLPDIVKEEDPDFSEIFNVMDEDDFVSYVEKRLGKTNMLYEHEVVTKYWR